MIRRHAKLFNVPARSDNVPGCGISADCDWENGVRDTGGGDTGGGDDTNGNGDRSDTVGGDNAGDTAGDNGSGDTSSSGEDFPSTSLENALEKISEIAGFWTNYLKRLTNIRAACFSAFQPKK